MAAPKELPRSFLRANMKVKVAQKSSTEPFESSENDLKIKNVNVHKTIEKPMTSLIFEAPKANWELRFASKRLLASDFEALEVSGTPRGDQESLKEVSKSSKVTIHRACRVIMSSPGALTDIDLVATRLPRGCDPPSALVIFAVDVVP